MNSTTQPIKKERKVLKKVNKELKTARRVAIVGATPDVTASVSRAEKAVRRRGPLKPSHLSRWAQALSLPFENEGAICPVNFNPAPSIMSTTARLTHTDLNAVVNAGNTRQMLFFPGHGAKLRTGQDPDGPVQKIFSDMDAVAYHYCGDYTNLLGLNNNIASSHVHRCRSTSDGMSGRQGGSDFCRVLFEYVSLFAYVLRQSASL